MSILSEPHFHKEEAAIARLEGIVWPKGPHCPKCGGFDRITPVKGGRAGLWRCGPCKREFTVTVGTIFERSHIPLHKWFQAAHLLASSKKGISAHQLHRTLKVTYKTAWFMAHRLREAMKDGNTTRLGGGMKHVEADETFVGNKKGFPKRPGIGHKMAVMSLVERGGSVRSVHVDSVTRSTVTQIIRENVAPDSKLSTDTAAYYKRSKLGVAEHGMKSKNVLGSKLG
jgi:transposase-like protein